jgi:pimeloyl-ACP methyl ester carboxylesterase
LRGVVADSAYIASYISQIDGPTILVGHSYGGAVISNAATTAKNVLALVFVAAYAPEKGETLGGAGANSKDSVLNSALVQRLYPTGKDGETAPEFIVDPAKFHDAFAADLPDRQSAVMAATQRPIAAGAFSEASGPPAWKTIPSWAVVAVGDKAAGTDVIRSMAQRAGAETIEIKGSHVIMVSQPDVVTAVILEALEAVAKPVAGAGVPNKP